MIEIHRRESQDTKVQQKTIIEEYTEEETCTFDFSTIGIFIKSH
jgi:hypothetical protein